MAPMKRLRLAQDDDETEDSEIESAHSSSRRDSVGPLHDFADRPQADVFVEEESPHLI